MSMRTSMQDFLRAESGATAIEYGLIAALVVVAIIASIQALGQSVFQQLWARIGAAF